MNSNDEHIIQKKIDSYLNDTMSIAERLLFEEEMNTNANLKEDVLLQKTISETLFNQNLSHVEDASRDEELATIKSTLQQEAYQNRIRNIKEVASLYEKKKQKKKFVYFGAIAALLLIFITLFLFPKQDSFETLYAEYSDWEELTSYVEQNTAQNEFSKGELLYNDKKYTEAIQFFEAYTKDQHTKLYAPGLLYLGASYFANDNSEKSLEIYDILINTDSYDSSKGHWYKLLIYLNQKDVQQVKATLEVILRNPSNYKYQEALKIKQAL